MARSIKVPVRLVITVDPQKWADNNGQIVDADGQFTIADVREDIRTYLLTLAQASALVDETDAEVSL